MFAGLAALIFASVSTATPAPPAPDEPAIASSVPADSATSRRIVRLFEPIVVEGGRRADPGSTETVYPMSSRALRALPVDRLVDALALQPGIVAVGEELHVRGGRTGDFTISTLGVPLNDPQGGRPMELPLFALRSADLLSGGLEADHTGSLAGELDVQTEVPTPKPAWMVRYLTDGRLGGSYDAGLVRLTGPAFGGLGFALAGEARLDDLSLPSIRTRSRRELLGANLGWRSDNHLLAWAKLASVEHPQRASIEAFGSRIVREPYNPMFTYDGWITPTGDPDSAFPFALSGEPHDTTSFTYRAADHLSVTDERRLAVIATKSFENPRHPERLSVGWLRNRSTTSVGFRQHPDYFADSDQLLWGLYNNAFSDPFLAYLGEQPYFKVSGSDRYYGRLDVVATPGRHQKLKAGVGFTYDHVRLYEIDDVAPSTIGTDSLRHFDSFAPGGFAFVQHRWEAGGLIWNAGLRLQAFTAGPQPRNVHPQWTLSPRLGFAYPISDKDAFSLAYNRIHQDPDRDLLYESRIKGYNRHPMGDSALVPAEMISYQAAIKHILDQEWSVQFGVFYRDVFAQPGVRVGPGYPLFYTLRYESADEGHANGVEFVVRHETDTGQHVELAYTFMDAWGRASDPDGPDYGLQLGQRQVPIGTHALDWNVNHALAFSAQLHTASEWQFSWSTRVQSGTPWTPVARDPGKAVPIGGDATIVNSRQLPWNENTDVAVRWAAKFLFGARILLNVTNAFDNRTVRRVSLSGAPNPTINTLENDYGAYYTETGKSGGAYYDPSPGQPEWVPVHDPRLEPRPRTLRLGVEIGH